MNKAEVMKRVGWTTGRVEKFLVVEHEYHKRGMWGSYVEYEYSVAQVLEAEKLPAWRKAAAKYLRVEFDELDTKIEEVEKEREAWRIAAEAESARFETEWKVAQDRIEAENAVVAARVRGGLQRIGFRQPLNDGWRTFSEEQVMEYIEFADRRGWIDADYILDFYRLWSAGSGYCNPLGTLRRLIAPVKNRIMRIMVHLAKKNQWVYGEAVDDRGWSVLYIDTPHGQASFHLRPGENGYPTYTRRWSGVRNSNEIIAKILGPKVSNSSSVSKNREGSPTIPPVDNCSAGYEA